MAQFSVEFQRVQQEARELRDRLEWFRQQGKLVEEQRLVGAVDIQDLPKLKIM